MERFKSLAHSKWECKYHVVWIPKYRRKVLYGERRQQIICAIKKWSKIKGVEILEGHAVVDHIHIVLCIPPKYSVSGVIGMLKGKSASEVMTYGKRASRMVRGRNFWARGYCVSTVGLDEKMIRAYVKHQEDEDKRCDEHGLF